jgi:hypothetical protein
MMATEKDNHAEQNARGWVESIVESVAAMNCDYDRLAELRDERDGYDEHDDECGQSGNWALDNPDEAEELAELEKAAGEFESADDARERIQESPLSVEIRSGWYAPGGEAEPEEFCVLLSTGGPALRIRGELDEHRQPRRAWLEHQDWGTPWIQFFDVEQDTLLAFCSVFYFGD